MIKTGGKFVKVGRKNNFRETGGKCTETPKIGRKFEICGRSLKKQKFWRMSRNFSGKGQIVNIFLKVRKFFGNRG